MEVRQAESDDRNRIRAITRDSLGSSYALSPQEIESILEAEFDDTALAELFEDTNTMVLVVEETVDGAAAVAGFVTVELGTAATIRWLHVDPEQRGGGLATALVEQVRETTAGRPLAASILDDAVEGGQFLEGFGLKQSSNEEVAIGGEEFPVTVFTEGESTATSNEPEVAVPQSVSMDGGERPLDRTETIPGREAPFFSVDTADRPAAQAYGYFCSQCGSTDISADGLDRLECGDCGNVHLADEWDDAYL